MPLRSLPVAWQQRLRASTAHFGHLWQARLTPQVDLHDSTALCVIVPAARASMQSGDRAN